MRDLEETLAVYLPVLLSGGADHKLCRFRIQVLDQ
jgi:hypothetical protein